MTGTVVRIMAEVLFILAIATNEVIENKAGEFDPGQRSGNQSHHLPDHFLFWFQERF